MASSEPLNCLMGRRMMIRLPSSGEVTLFVDCIPKNLKRNQMMAWLNGEGFRDMYDLLYLPRSFETHENKGYAFINFTEVEYASAFIAAMHGRQMGPDSTITVSDSKTQGLEANLARWGRSRSRRVRNPEAMLYVRRRADPESSTAPAAPAEAAVADPFGAACLQNSEDRSRADIYPAGTYDSQGRPSVPPPGRFHEPAEPPVRTGDVVGRPLGQALTSDQAQQARELRQALALISASAPPSRPSNWLRDALSAWPRRGSAGTGTSEEHAVTGTSEEFTRYASEAAEPGYAGYALSDTSGSASDLRLEPRVAAGYASSGVEKAPSTESLDQLAQDAQLEYFTRSSYQEAMLKANRRSESWTVHARFCV